MEEKIAVKTKYKCGHSSTGQRRNKADRGRGGLREAMSPPQKVEKEFRDYCCNPKCCKKDLSFVAQELDNWRKLTEKRTEHAESTKLVGQKLREAEAMMREYHQDCNRAREERRSSKVDEQSHEENQLDPEPFNSPFDEAEQVDALEQEPTEASATKKKEGKSREKSTPRKKQTSEMTDNSSPKEKSRSHRNSWTMALLGGRSVKTPTKAKDSSSSRRKTGSGQRSKGGSANDPIELSPPPTFTLSPGALADDEGGILPPAPSPPDLGLGDPDDGASPRKKKSSRGSKTSGRRKHDIIHDSITGKASRE